MNDKKNTLIAVHFSNDIIHLPYNPLLPSFVKSINDTMLELFSRLKST